MDSRCIIKTSSLAFNVTNSLHHDVEQLSNTQKILSKKEQSLTRKDHLSRVFTKWL
jgi:hypothetical protein